jgi:acyl-CoA reductase-like NAD-dependent aldehyde dehydrogenase
MIRNLIGKDWRTPVDGVASLPVFNPATGEVIEQVPLSGDREVDAAVTAAAKAYAEWSRTAVMERVFRERVEAGMTGINVPIAQPFAFFPFSGWKGSFYGDLHVHGTDGVDFYTRKKVVVTRW